jgi:hypothetical protein
MIFLNSNFFRKSVCVLIYFFCFIGFVLWCLQNINDAHNWGGDFASYIQQGVSINQDSIDHFMAENRIVIQDSSILLGPVAYPWGYPILLSLIYSFVEMDFQWLKAINVFFHGCTILFLSYWFYRKLPIFLYFVCLILFIFNTKLLYSLNDLISDIVFLTFSTIAVCQLNDVKKCEAKAHWLTLLLIIFCCLGAMICRRNGILIPLALLACLIISLNSKLNTCTGLNLTKNTRLQYFSIVFTSCSLFWIYSMFFPNGDEPHVEYLKENLSVESLNSNFWHYSFVMVDFFKGYPGSKFLYGMSLPFLFLGLSVHFKKHFFILLYGFFTIVLFWLWPYEQGLRFFYPLIPFYLYFVALGIKEFPQKLHAFSNLFSQGFSILLIILVMNSIKISYSYRKESESNATSSCANEMYEFVKDHVPKVNKVFFWKPRVLHLFTGRISIASDEIFQLQNKDRVCIIKSQDVRYSFGKRNIENLIVDSQFEIEFENSEFLIFCFNRIGRDSLL